MKKFLPIIIFLTIGLGSTLLIAKDTSLPVSTNSLTLTLPEYKGSISWATQLSTGKSKASIVGIHGTPGGWIAWRSLMSQKGIEEFSFFAFDRPGWGNSQSTTGQMYPSLSDQADILAAAFLKIDLPKPIILVAHSWGGPVALELSAQYPQLVDGLVLIASPANPVVSQPRWYHKAARLKAVQWVIGKSMTRSNTEMLALDTELISLSKLLIKITQPTVIMQGKKDWLVKPQNAFYLRRMLENAPVNLWYDLQANHFIPFKQTDRVLEAINWVQQKTTVLTKQTRNL